VNYRLAIKIRVISYLHRDAGIDHPRRRSPWRPTGNPGGIMTQLLFEHFVVLMLENRSFDHLFGYLGVGDGLAGVSTTNYLKPLDKKTTAFNAQRGGDYTAIGQGPSHSLKETNMQLFGKTNVPANMPADQATMSGFVASFATSLKPTSSAHRLTASSSRL